jgi:hypothetical protein
MKQLIITINDDLHKEIKKIAADKEKSIKDLVIPLLEKLIKIEQ